MMMRRVSLSHFGVVLVGGLNLWLLAVTASNLRSGGEITVDKVEWKPDLMSSFERTEKKKKLESYQQILAQPIFYKTRKPFVPPPPTPVVNATPPATVVDPGFIVAGVIITGEIKRAYIYTKTNNSGTWTKEGEDFLGWKVRSVDRDSVRLEQAGRTIEISLYPQINSAQH
jgi:hypothetical protein